ncbi:MULTISPECIES: hypothetical protein [unclassified Bartonella]
MPKLSGLIGGFYTGSNFDLGIVLILGVATDAVWARPWKHKNALRRS